MYIEIEGTVPKRCLYCGGLMTENMKHECITGGNWSSSLKIKDYKVNEPIVGMFPRANEQDSELGWTLSYEFLESIQEQIMDDEDALSLEGIELVLLAVEKKI
jgi:hypothetical protein